MGDQGVVFEIEAQPERGIESGDAAVEFDPEGGIGIAAVVVDADRRHAGVYSTQGWQPRGAPARFVRPAFRKQHPGGPGIQSRIFG